MIIYTNHAIKRRRERGIQKSEIEKVVRNPDHTKRTDHRVVADKKLNGKTLEIVFVKERGKTIILTCYYL